jgi:hypothetical protein
VQPCTGTNAIADSGTPDAGPPDAEVADAESPDADAGESDAGVDAGEDAGEDASNATPDAGALAPPVCDGFDDLDVATTGMHTYDVWVTRLRAVLPAEALGAGDLRLQAAAVQTVESNVHYATSYSDDSSAKQTRKSCAGAPLRHEPFTPIVFGIAAALAAAAFARRRGR